MQSEVCYIMKWHKPKVELHACVGPFYPAVSPDLQEQLPVLLSNHVLHNMSRSDVPEVRRVHGPPLGKFVCVPPDPPQDDGAVALWALHQETKQGKLTIRSGPGPIGDVTQRLPKLGPHKEPWANVTIGDADRHKGLLSDAVNADQGGATRLQNKFAFSDKDYMRATTDELSRRNAALNMAVYEQLVADKYVEEELVCALYLQRVQRRSEEMKRAHRETCELNRERCASIDTPYERSKRRITREAAMVREAVLLETPRFRDIDELVTPRLRAEDLHRRNPDMFPKPPPLSSGWITSSSALSTPRDAHASSERTSEMDLSARSIPVPAPPQSVPMRGPASPRELLDRARMKLSQMGGQGLHNPPFISQVPTAVSHTYHRIRILDENGFKLGKTRSVPSPHESAAPGSPRSSVQDSPRNGSTTAEPMISMKWANASRPLTF